VHSQVESLIRSKLPPGCAEGIEDRAHSKTRAKAQPSCYKLSRRPVDAFGAHTTRLKAPLP